MDRSLNLGSLSSHVPVSLQTPPGNPEFVNLPEKLKCLVCNNVMRDAMMTVCGHRMCEACLVQIIYNPQNDGPIPCPGNEEFCDVLTMEECRGDNATRRDIRKLSVFCTNKPYGCTQKVQWKDLAKHELECVYSPHLCPHTGCEEKYTETDLQAHIKTCNYRPVRCSHCGETVPYCSQAEHLENTCKKALISCPYKCGLEQQPREQVEDHMKSCRFRPQKCKFSSVGCEFVGSENDLTVHYSESADDHLQMITMYTASMDLHSMEMKRELQDISIERETIQNVLKSLQRDSRMLQDMVDQIQKGQRELQLNIVEKTERLIHLEKKVDNIARSEVIERLSRDLNTVKEKQNAMGERLTVIDSGGLAAAGGQGSGAVTGTLAAQVKQHDKQIGLQDIRLAELDLRFQVLETVSYSGVLMWKIRDYSRRKQEAVTGRTVSLYSQPFYTSRFGYKMCARLYLNGDGMGKGTHLSLFFVVMRGEYDALLNWPFQQKVTLLLLDQDTGGRHISDTFRPDPVSTSFKKPTTDMNVASGCPLFAAHSVLETRTYLKDDTIFIKVIVETENINGSG